MNETLQADGPHDYLPPYELVCLYDIFSCSYVAVKLDFHSVAVKPKPFVCIVLWEGVVVSK